MTQLTQIIFPALAAGALAAITYLLSGWVFSRLSGPQKALAQFSGRGDDDSGVVPARMGSEAYKIRLAFAGYGLDVAGKEKVALYLAYLLVGGGLVLVLALVGMPPAVWLAGAAIAFVFVNGMVTGKWMKVRQSIEKEIPTMLIRLASTIQANQNVLDTLDEVTESLDPDGHLQGWMRRLVKKMQAEGQMGLKEMQDEAKDVSPALLLVVVEVGRLWETGGGGYAEAFKLASNNLSGLLETRAEAYATADGAWGTVRVIVLALGAAVGSVMINPATKTVMSGSFAQIGLLLALVWAAVGWWYIGDVIRDVTE